MIFSITFEKSVKIFQKNTFRINKNRNIALDFDLKSKVLHNILKENIK